MSGESKRILIMEDSDIFADMLMEFLASPEYVLERAVNGFEGIKKVYHFLPHLIITDVEMPLFKGYQVTRLLKSRKNTKAIPIIMFTTLGETKDKFWGGQAGADAYIEKSPDNFQPLSDALVKILSTSEAIDFSAIEREAKRVNDDSIIEMTNNLLDNKLFQTTVIGMLTELSNKAHSLEMVVSGIFELLHTVCEAEIVTMMVRGAKGLLHVFIANFAGFSKEITDNFSGICISDFNNLFPDFHVSTKNTHDSFPPANNQKKIESYITIPLTVGGEKIASVHIANSINEYFTLPILENINIFLGAATPIIANALSMRELDELQKNTRTAFARYVPADVMDEIIHDSSKAGGHSENRNITVLFSDIRDFTGIAEHSDAQGTVDFLNAYFAKMGNEIISEDGQIDKFIGDAIMAVFGAYRILENPAASAIRAAIRMLAVLEDIDTTSIGLRQGSLKSGIGINCGECVLGNIGFQNKMDYTVIGDTVNLASRVEGLTKQYRHPLIVSEYVYNMTKNHFLFRKIDNVRVKGKKEPVGIYAIYTGFEGTGGNVLRSGEISDMPTVPSLQINREILANYNKGLQLFYMHEWKHSQEYFLKAVENNKNDFLSQLYMDRAHEFANTPPPKDWDGVVTLVEK
ncbi:MAG: response regulator [Treponema sp.]|jgi:class 3 adenylate cyclase/DNA-binding response OmpR family regulator|nr:response regulator [Treponema sp.]